MHPGTVIFEFGCFSFLTVVVTMYCDAEKDSSHIPGREGALLHALFVDRQTGVMYASLLGLL
jgi:hypothetical protein